MTVKELKDRLNICIEKGLKDDDIVACFVSEKGIIKSALLETINMPALNVNEKFFEDKISVGICFIREIS